MDRNFLNDQYKISDITKKDISSYVDLLKVKQIADQTLNIPYPYTEEDAQWWVSHVDNLTKKLGWSSNWAIRNQNGNLIGGIGFQLGEDFKINHTHRAEIGYWLGEPFWNKGIMTEAVKEVVKIGFEELKLIRITAHVFHFNEGSARVLEKAGFQLEGVLRKHYLKNGNICDGKIYALLRKQE